jgi:peptidoglycan/LPS O-acetylase OafA/YrhL
MENQRFAALDGLRGICALIVLLFHAFHFATPKLFAHGFLSVDIFFLLSGFVLAFAFGNKLAAGLGIAGFMRARVHRLGPVMWFAAVFSVVACLAVEWFRPSHIPAIGIVLAGIQNAFLVPMTGPSTTDAFPLNGPSWSLFAEIWINVGFALVATRLTRTALAAIVAAGWTFLVIHSLRLGTADFGASQAEIFLALPRSVPSFALGVLIFKLWRVGALRKIPSVPPLLVFALWTAVSLIPGGGPLFELAQIMITAPAMLVLLVASSRLTPGWCLWLGRLSYPLYATHAIIINSGRRLGDGRLALWAVIALSLAALLLADMLARWYEPAVRRGLQSRRATAAISGAAV